MISIADLTVGSECLCWMRLGYALKLAVGGDGTPYRFVPQKPGVASAGDLTRFTGYVLKNEPEYRVITFQVTPNDSHNIATNRESHVAAVAYQALQRLQLFSTISYEPRAESLFHPTRKAIGTAYRAYRTLTEVRLP